MKRMVRALAAGVAVVIAGLSSAAGAADVQFMTWTYTEETGQTIVQKMIDDFKAQSGLEVEPQGYAWGEMSKNLFLRDRSNTLPDVTQVQERLLPTYANIDEIVDLNGVFGRETLTSMFSPAFLAMGEVDGKQIGLPWIGGTIGMIANKAVLDQAGVTEIPTTLAAFREALVKVRDSVPNSVPYTMATKNNASIVIDYLIWVWTHGGDVIDAENKPVVNSAEAKAALNFMADLMKERLSAPEIDRPDARRLFGQGASAFYIDAPQARTFARQFSGQGEAYDANVVPMKTPVAAEGNTPTSIQWGHVLSMFSTGSTGSTEADGPSGKWLMYLVADKTLIDYAADQSALPTTVSGLASERIASDTYLSAWAAASVEPRRNTIAGLSNGAEVQDIIGEEVQAALLGQKSADDAADSMQARLEEAMANAQ